MDRELKHCECILQIKDIKLVEFNGTPKNLSNLFFKIIVYMCSTQP